MRKLLMAVAVVAVGGTFAVRSLSSDVQTTQDGAHDAKLLRDRVWIERMPKHDKDRIEVFLVLSPRKAGRAGPVGAFEKVSSWEGHYQAFRYENEGDQMRIVFPQTGEKETLTVKATRCNEGRMDYCLDVTGNGRGAHRYYSRKGMELDSLAGAEAVIRDLAPVAR